MLDEAPWTARASYIVSLCFSVIAVIMALHQTVYLNSIDFLATADAITALFGRPHSLMLPQSQGRLTPTATKHQIHKAIHIYGLPQLMLTYSIFSLFIGIGLTTVSALWSQEPPGIWDGPQKVRHLNTTPCRLL